MTEQQLSIPTDIYKDAVTLHYRIWNSQTIYNITIDRNNFLFNDIYIAVSMKVRKGYGVILNEIPYLYTQT